MPKGTSDEDGFHVEIHDSSLTNPNKITLNLQSASVEQEGDQFQQPELHEIPEYYKLATPVNLTELEWTVTLSRYDFPWNEISF